MADPILDKVQEIYTAVEDLQKKAVKQEDLDGKVKVLTKEGIEQATSDLKTAVEDLQVKLNRGALDKIEGEPGDKKEAKALGNYYQKGASVLGPDELKYLATDVEATGGYVTLPPTISSNIIEVERELSDIIAAVSEETIPGDELVLPEETGQFLAVRVTERGARAETTTGGLGTRNYKPWPLYVEPPLTNKMVDMTGFDIVGYVSRKCTEAFALTKASEIWNGDGKSKARGLLTVSDLVKVKSGGASGFAASAPADVFWDMVGKLKARYLINAEWRMSVATFVAIMKLKDGQSNYLHSMGNIQGAWVPMLLGFPVKFDNNLPAIAAAALPVAFGNFKESYQAVRSNRMFTIRDQITKKGWTLFYTDQEFGGDVRRVESYCTLSIEA